MGRDRRLRAGFAAGVAALALVITGCASSPASSSAAASGTTAGGTGELSGTGLKIDALTTMDSGTQIQYFNQAIAQKPDLIVLAVDDTKATVVPIEQAKQAGIPVLAFDGPTDPSVAGDVMSVLSNNEELGEFAAQNLIQGLLRVKEGGEIADEVRPGSPVYACALGGADGRTLFACAAPDFDATARSAAQEAALLAIRVQVPAA